MILWASNTVFSDIMTAIFVAYRQKAKENDLNLIFVLSYIFLKTTYNKERRNVSVHAFEIS